MLPVPVKIYLFEIFTRATPGSCLVFHIGPSRFTDFIFASQSLRLPHQILSCFMYSLHSLQGQIPTHLISIHPTLWIFEKVIYKSNLTHLNFLFDPVINNWMAEFDQIWTFFCFWLSFRTPPIAHKKDFLYLCLQHFKNPLWTIRMKSDSIDTGKAHHQSKSLKL